MNWRMVNAKKLAAGKVHQADRNGKGFATARAPTAKEVGVKGGRDGQGGGGQGLTLRQAGNFMRSPISACRGLGGAQAGVWGVRR
jgi:hypothetical protein